MKHSFYCTSTPFNVLRSFSLPVKWLKKKFPLKVLSAKRKFQTQTSIFSLLLFFPLSFPLPAIPSTVTTLHANHIAAIPPIDSFSPAMPLPTFLSPAIPSPVLFL